MLKNIWYCIKKTSEWYFALLVLYIILTLVNATIPILSAFLPKLVIEKLTLGSDIKGLIGTIMVFMGSIAVLTGVSKFLTKTSHTSNGNCSLKIQQYRQSDNKLSPCSRSG